MRTVVIATLRGNLRRLIGTSFAVCLGVAFLAGTLVLSDTLRANFDSLFEQALGRTDVVVRRADTLTTDVEVAQGLVDVSLADELREVDGVRAVVPAIEGFGQITGKDGEKLGGEGPPTLAGNWIEDRELNPYELVDGRAPRTPNEVVINRGAADDGDLRVGDTTIVATPEPVDVTIVGIATFGGEDGLGPTTFTAFSLEGAEQHILGRSGVASSLLVAADDGVDVDALRASIAQGLPEQIEAITGADLVDESNDTIDADFLGFLRGFLLVFAMVALVVATFSIYNTFSILVAQRSREAALLRAVGASRRQVLGAVIAESAIVGVVASLVGVVAGLGLAGLLKGLFDAFGFALPAGGLTMRPTTFIVAPLVGLAITLVAGVGPAVRSSRIPPLAAIRDVAVDRTGASRLRAVLGMVLTVAGVAVTFAAVVGGTKIGLAGFGAFVLLVGTVVLGPVVARPAAVMVGAPIVRWRGVAGRLAVRNAQRSPRRMSASASALLVGVGVVTLFTVVAASLKASVDDTVNDVVDADLIIAGSQFGGGGISPGLPAVLEEAPEVASAVGVATGPIAVDGSTKQVSVLDPRHIDGLLSPESVDGDVAALGPNELAVAESVADRNDWRVGSEVDVTFTDGATERMRVGAIYTAGQLIQGYVVPRATWERHAVQTVDNLVLVGLADGVDLEAGRRAVEAAAAPFAPPDVEDREQFVASVSANVDMMLGLIYAMLALAIVIALMGIANTLSLGVHERIRELGLLRAVGQTRRQVRSMVRWESVLVALFGTVGGLLVGLFLGWALVEAASEDAVRFALPGGQLVPIVVIGALAGVLAAIRPARRAAKLPVLEAVAAT